MAETAGLVIGGVSLSALFTSCVDCFEYIKLGRSFGKNYTRCLLKLDITRLKLSRWADSVNESQNRFKDQLRTEDDVKNVQKLLGEIISIFADAERVSKRFKTVTGSPVTEVMNPDTDLPMGIQSLHHNMAKLALERQRRSRFTQKMSWALYEESHWRKLLEDLSGLVDGLVELFPPAQKRQQELCAVEVEKLELDVEDVEILEQSAEGVDHTFQAAIQQAAARASGHEYVGNRASDESRAQYGNQIDKEMAVKDKSHVYRDNQLYGKSRALYGDRYGERCVIDD